MLAAHLSEALRKKHGKRSIPVVKGDKVKVVRGQHKGRENKIESGSKSLIPLKPSNVIITELNLEDKKRKAVLEGKATTTGKNASKPVDKPVDKPADKPVDEPADKREAAEAKPVQSTEPAEKQS
jgi:large subunit ribosomal protein L24